MAKLSIIIPVYNEKETVLGLVDRVRAVKLKKLEREIVVIDDGSTDGTRDLIEAELGGSADVKVIMHGHNQGKGAALRTGIAQSTGDIVIIQDADFEYDPNEYPILIGPILAGEADVVYGSRFMGGQPKRVLHYWHYLGNKFLTTLSNMFTDLNLTDMETCYKVFRGDLIRRIEIEENRFGFEPEITAKLSKERCRIYEVGIGYAGRTYDEGKKITWKDGVRALYCILKYR